MSSTGSSPALLHEAALQVVPLLLIALFLDAPDGPASGGRLARWWNGAQDKIFAVLGTIAFITSLLVVADAIHDNRVTQGLVISALSLAISLLFARIWRRFDDRNRSGS